MVSMSDQFSIQNTINTDEGKLSEDGFGANPALSPNGGAATTNQRRVIGKVASPPMREATSDEFHFWVPRGELVEKTQIVYTESQIGREKIEFYAVVNEVYRQSRKRSIGEEFDTFDGDISYEPEFGAEGVTFATASILRTQPPVLTPPLEQSSVFLGNENDASKAYGADEVENPLSVGLIKNGGSIVAGPGVIDLDYLLGINGGHMNVNGAAGRGTKSSFLLFVNWLLLDEARRQQQERPSDENRLRVIPIILNVKNFDLFHIDRWSKAYKLEKHLTDWQSLGIDQPCPFENVTFFASQQPSNTLPVPTGRKGEVQPFSWSLSDIIEQGLLSYLFAETDAQDVNFGALILDIENWLTNERVANDGTVTRSLRTGNNRPSTFQKLLKWVDGQINTTEDQRTLRNHHASTWKKLHRRLLKLVYDSRGVLRRDDQRGNPLNLVRGDTSDPVVVDLAALAGKPELQRFVVATILRQLVEARTGSNAIPGLVYLVTLDELNRFAPSGARDPITRLIEMVAAEMRSQGIILLGAQQQASKVSEKVIENAAIRVLGKSGSVELGKPVWNFLTKSARRKAENLRLEEKLVIQDNFREPMHVRVPFPVWAMNPREARNTPLSNTSDSPADDLLDVIDE
jgi:DNA helicase HerA-like ATPase